MEDRRIYTYKLYVVIALLIFIILMMIQCDRKVVPSVQGRKQLEQTIIVKSHTDTIKFVDTVYIKIPVKILVPVIDTIDNTNVYTNPFEDSLIKGTITSKVDGVLVNQDFTYKPKFPKYIIKTDSIFIETTYEAEPKWGLYAGLEVGGSTTKFNFSPIITLQDKKNRLYNYKYNIIDKTHNIGLQIKLK